jgi:hypothetical protein
VVVEEGFVQRVEVLLEVLMRGLEPVLERQMIPQIVQPQILVQVVAALVLLEIQLREAVAVQVS